MDAITNIFKAYDIRGEVGTELTPSVAESIGKAFADWLPETGTVAVGRDMRPDSAELADALIAGLQAQGRTVINIGEVTSDMIYFAVGSLKLAGGAMVTASHNPGKYNGIKLCREEARPIGQDSGLFEIRDAIISGTYKPSAPQPGNIEQQDVSEDWITHVLSFIDVTRLNELNIAVDAGNGMAGKIFPELEPYVPWQVQELYFELDGTFPNHEANPLKFETLADLIACIKSQKLDGGIAFDGDGDRAFLVDETGTVLSGNVMNAMLAEYFLQKFPGSTILYDLRSSHAIPELIEANGGRVVRTRVGHSFIKQVMREQNAPFGGEISGHFYFRDNYYADSGLIAAVIGLYVAGLSGKKLSELRKQYTKYPTISETNFEVANKDTVFARLKEAFKDAKQDELDGLTFEFSDGSWLNVRASNTEPVMRLNAEAKSQAELDRLVSKVTALIKGE
ncbi:MAG TPA: phosphomannomutase/phosphoglucomutase [Candidatus Saccharimonadia bacterium]|nr:phosphomannomutase/phosphoglucomutase [Candidatus Saccharimonadia bacterium]